MRQPLHHAKLHAEAQNSAYQERCCQVTERSYVTVREAHLQTGVSIAKIMRRIRTGKIQAEKVGWIWTIPKVELPKLQ
jgi:hypothetical protein